MPNWCYNSVKIQGDPEELKRFISFSHGDNQGLSFDKILPAPAGIFDKAEDAQPVPSGGGIKMPDWYEWCCANWGTKWDVDSPVNNDVTVSVSPASLDYTFQTAWAPPIPVIHAAAESFPKLKFDHIYIDESMDFAGRFVWLGGKSVSQKELSSGDKEYDCISRGSRVEEDGVHDTGWVEDIPTAAGVAIVSKKQKGEGGKPAHLDLERILAETPEHEAPKPPDPMERQRKIDSLHRKIDDGRAIQKLLTTELVRVAKELGFDFDAWKKSGLDPESGDLWSVARKAQEGMFKRDDGVKSIAQIQIKPRKTRSAEKSENVEPEIRVVLRSDSTRGNLPGRPEFQHGSIRLFQYGVELITPGGWSVQGLVREGEQGYIIVLHGGKFQNPVSGEPCCTEWSAGEDGGSPIKTAEAFCVDGKLWDPSKGQSALTTWHKNGQKKLEARFINNKNFSSGDRPSAVHYRDDGSIEKSETKRRRLGGKGGQSTENRAHLKRGGIDSK
jgi:hypothetical protein